MEQCSFFYIDNKLPPVGELTPVETPDELYEQLVEKIKQYHPTDNFSMLKKAYDLAKEAHKDQKRKSGEPYIIHPLKVAIILAELELDMETIVAGILHDTIEDTPYTYDDIKNLFGEDGEDISYLWFNRQTPEGVRMELTFFVKRRDGAYDRFEETHFQYAHGEETIVGLLKEAGFVRVETEGHLGGDKTERINFFAYKR